MCKIFSRSSYSWKDVGFLILEVTVDLHNSAQKCDFCVIFSQQFVLMRKILFDHGRFAKHHFVVFSRYLCVRSSMATRVEPNENRSSHTEVLDLIILFTKFRTQVKCVLWTCYTLEYATAGDLEGTIADPDTLLWTTPDECDRLLPDESFPSLP